MATYYGTDNPLEEVRTLLTTTLTALIAQMVTDSVDPRFAAVYTSHTGTVPMTFPCATIGTGIITQTFPALKSDPGGPAVSSDVTATIRVLIGYRNAYMDELKIGRLINSTLNWFQEHRALDSGNRIWNELTATVGDSFDETDTIGGTITLLVRSYEGYTAA
jgi:hypothetical protein